VADLSLTQLLQLYAPLAGLLVVAFMLGTLSNRVKTLERERQADKAQGEREREEMKAAALAVVHEGREDHDTLILLAGDMKTVKDTLEKMDRNWQGVQRQLASLSSGKFTKPMNAD
jgi:hypothetical protein